MNILLVDHELYRLESLERGLKIMGYGVLAASNVKEAIACLESDHPPIDLIITDCATPLAVNSEIIQTIGRRQRSIPVLMMTTNKKENHESHPLWTWCEEIIEKPFELDRLVQLIESADKGSTRERLG